MATALAWIEQPGSVQEIGHGGNGFCFDNETPRHRVLLSSYALGSRLVTNSEYLAFIAERKPVRGNLREPGYLHPAPVTDKAKPAQLYGDVWEWTRNPTRPIPATGRRQARFGEYNGKFMVNQPVLRVG